MLIEQLLETQQTISTRSFSVLFILFLVEAAACRGFVCQLTSNPRFFVFWPSVFRALYALSAELCDRGERLSDCKSSLRSSVIDQFLLFVRSWWNLGNFPTPAGYLKTCRRRCWYPRSAVQQDCLKQYQWEQFQVSLCSTKDPLWARSVSKMYSHYASISCSRWLLIKPDNFFTAKAFYKIHI